MFGVGICLACLIVSAILLRRIAFLFSMSNSGEYYALNKDVALLEQATDALEEQNRQLNNLVDEHIALFNFSKDICRFLDEQKLISFFEKRLRNWIEFGDCKFVFSNELEEESTGAKIVALKINRSVIGYLKVTGLTSHAQATFDILIPQFLLGLKRAVLYRRVQELAITDGLTQTFSRRYFLERFHEELNRSQKYRYSLAFLMIDIDRFKECNDTFGHLVGDAILRDLSKILKDNLRVIDFIGRFGGEELGVVLSETNKEGALIVAERIRKAVEDQKFHVYDENLTVTVSVGVAMFPSDTLNGSELIEKADAALYKAKNSGRNRVCF